MKLNNDPRWRRLHGQTWTCPVCNEKHQGLFDLACDAPEQWPRGDKKIEPDGAAASSSHVLTHNFCILEGEHYFVRCVLEMPIIGASDENFAYGVWSSLSHKNFEIYRLAFEDDERDDLGPWFGWFSNRLKGYPETLNLKCKVHPRSGRQRPWLELEPTDHPLALEQRNGITFDRLLELYALNGHDIAPALVG